MKKIRTKLLAALLAVSMILGLLPVISSAASPVMIDSTAEYVLVNKATGQALERTLDTTYIPTRDDVFRVVANAYAESTDQRWQLQLSGGGYRLLCVSNRGIGLHKTAESYENIPGANYVMAVDTNAPPQQTWIVEDAGEGYVTLKNDLREQTGGHDLPQYLAVTQDAYTEISGSFVVAAIAERDTDRALWKLEKVPGTGEPDPEPLDPFEPVENVVADAQTMLEPGSVQLNGMVNEAALHVQNDELKTLDWKRLVDQFRYKTDTDNRWRSEFWGKYMRGACFTYAYTQDEELYNILEESIRDILTTQEVSGRLTSYPSDWGTWDIWGRKYVMLGMQSFLEICQDEELHGQIMESLCRQADYMLRFLGPESEGKTPIVNTGYWSGIASCSILEPMANLYRMTGYQRYLDFCTHIVESGLTNQGVNIFELALEGEKIPSEYFYNQAKAYEMTSCFEGLAEYYRLTGEEKWRTACLNYYRLASENEITVCGSGGGVGRGAGYHYFNPNGDEQWNNMAVNQTDPTIGQMQETCITVTWMKYCFQMLRLAGDPAIADDIELSTYNALLAALKAEGVETADYPFLFDYFTLLNGTHKNPWGGAIFESDGTPIGSCCSANGSSGTGLVPYIQLTRSENGVVFNLYNPGTITAPAPSGQPVEFSVDTTYPKEGNIKITVNPSQEEQFSLALRIPAWSTQTTLLVNGQPQTAEAGQYVELSRNWTAGDTIELTLDMRTRIVSDLKGLGMVALQRGPITLARDARFGENIDKPVWIATDADGYAVVTPVETDIPCNMAFDVATEDGGSFRVLDYASAGQTWDTASRYATWLTTGEAVDPGLQQGAQYLLTSQGTGIAMTANPDTSNVEKGDAAETPSDNQLWSFVPFGDYYKVIQAADGRALTADSNAPGNGTNVILREDTGADNQLWTVTKSGDGFIKIAGKSGGQLVSESGESSNIHLWEDVANPVQVWKLTLIRPAVDKSDLLSAIQSAGEYEGREAEFTPQSWATFSNALDEANRVYSDPDTSQEDVNLAAQALREAMDDLAPLPAPEVNKSILKTVLEYAQQARLGVEYAGAIESVQNSFDAALTRAQQVYDDPAARQAEIDTAWMDLMKEIHKLGFQAGDKSQLNFVYQQAANLDLSNYVPAGQEEFLAALGMAESLLADGDAMQPEVDEAVDRLLDAMLALRFQADKTLLNLLLVQASELDLSLYTTESVQAFASAQAEAAGVAANSSLTDQEQAVVDAAAASLREAIDGLVLRATVQGDSTASRNAGIPRTGEALPAATAVVCLLAGILLQKAKRRQK